MQREKVQLEINRPVTIGLKFSKGLEMPDNGYGPAVLYTTTDDRALFVDPQVAYDIRKLDLAPGETICVVKRKKGRGPAQICVWLSPDTEKARAELDGELEPPPPAEPPAGLRGPAPKLPPTKFYDPTAEQLEGTLRNVAEGRAPAAPRPTPTPAPIAERLNQHPAPPIKPTYAEAMAEFLMLAGRATRSCEVQLGADGAAVKFDSRDVAALATTMFIQACRDGFVQFKRGDK